MEKKNRRKTIMINWAFQARMIGVFVAINVFLMVMFQLAIYLFMDSEIDTMLSRTHVTLLNVRDMLVPMLISLSMLNILISSLAIAAFVLFASFRIAGPLYRFHVITNDINNRNFDTYTRIRTGDQLYNLAQEMEQMKYTLSGDISLLINELNAAKKTIGGDSDALEDHLDRMDEILGAYRLPPAKE